MVVLGTGRPVQASSGHGSSSRCRFLSCAVGRCSIVAAVLAGDSVAGRSVQDGTHRAAVVELRVTEPIQECACFLTAPMR